MAKQKRPQIDYSNAGAKRVASRAPTDTAGFRAAVERSNVAQTVVDAALVDYSTTSEVEAIVEGVAIPDGTSAGDLLYWDGDEWAVLPSGSGVLTNTAGVLSWETP